MPLSRAKDFTALDSILHVLGTRSRLETVQALLEGPKLTADLPARADELHMLQDIGIVTSQRLSRARYEWSFVPGALDQVAACLISETPAR